MYAIIVANVFVKFGLNHDENSWVVGVALCNFQHHIVIC